MATSRTDRPQASHSSSLARETARFDKTDERIANAIRELQEVLADRPEDHGALAALETLRDALCVANTRASVDPLTGLMNRASFDRALEEALERAALAHTDVALLFLDLDGFKAVNDQRGHAAGDRLLKEVAARIMGCMRDDDLLARYGGDEFVVALENVADRQIVHAVASRIINCLSGIFTVEGEHVHLSVSVGVALYPEHAITVSELLSRADAAMYEAKRQGGARYLLWRAHEATGQSGSFAKFESGQRSVNELPARRA